MAKRISLKERICFWLLKRRFTTETYVMLDRLGNYHVSTRKKGHKVYHMIDKEYANDLCLAHHVLFDFKPGQEKLVSHSVAAVF